MEKNGKILEVLIYNTDDDENTDPVDELFAQMNRHCRKLNEMIVTCGNCP